MEVLAEEELTLEEEINQMNARRGEISKLEAMAKALKSVNREAEHRIIQKMEELGLKKSATSTTSVSISENVVPQVDPEHWPEVFETIYKRGYWELFRKQLNSGPFKELLAMGEEIPHVQPATLKKLNIRSNK